MLKTRKMALLATSALLGLAAFAFAQQNGNGAQNPSYTGSLPVRENLSTQQYQALAKVSMQDAIKAVQAALGTTATPSRAKLGVENGYLVWEVVIGGQEVKVDAGNGKILHQEAVGGEEGEHDGVGGEEGEHDGEGEGQEEGD
ncbi:MAG: peptidase [Meiothermus sp.]